MWWDIAGDSHCWFGNGVRSSMASCIPLVRVLPSAAVQRAQNWNYAASAQASSGTTLTASLSGVLHVLHSVSLFTLSLAHSLSPLLLSVSLSVLLAQSVLVAAGRPDSL